MSPPPLPPAPDDRHRAPGFERPEDARSPSAVQAANLIAGLTQREHQIVSCVIRGKTSKEIARALGISHRTVETYRVRISLKMQASNMAQLIFIVGMGAASRPGILELSEISDARKIDELLVRTSK